MQAFWDFMAIFMAFLPKSLIRNQIRFFRFYPIFIPFLSDFFPIFRLFPTFRLSDSTALIETYINPVMNTMNRATFGCGCDLASKVLRIKRFMETTGKTFKTWLTHQGQMRRHLVEHVH